MGAILKCNIETLKIEMFWNLSRPTSYSKHFYTSHLVKKMYAVKVRQNTCLK